MEEGEHIKSLLLWQNNVPMKTFISFIPHELSHIMKTMKNNMFFI